MKVAYILTKFPGTSETFVVREIQELSNLGIQVQPYSLKRVRAGELLDPFMERWHQRTTYVPTPVDPRVIWSLWRCFLREPGRTGQRLAQCTSGNVRRLRALLVSLFVFPQALYIAEHCRKSQVSWIHAHFAGAGATAAWIAYALTGIPYSFTPHATDLYTEWFTDELLCEKIRDASFVVSISEYNLRHLQRVAGVKDGDERFPIIRCGVGPEYWGEDPPARSKGGIFRILCIGRMVEKKGHIYLLKALKLLKTEGRKFHCVIVGGGPLEKKLHQYVREVDLQDSVEFRGILSQEGVRGALDETDIFCLPSAVAPDGDRDGLPVVLMEAMARQIPTISTIVSGIPELIRDGENGVLVPERDERALANAIRWLMDDRQLGYRLGVAARETIKCGFNLNVEVRKLRDRLTSELERRRADQRGTLAKIRGGG